MMNGKSPISTAFKNTTTNKLDTSIKIDGKILSIPAEILRILIYGNAVSTVDNSFFASSISGLPSVSLDSLMDPVNLSILNDKAYRSEATLNLDFPIKTFLKGVTQTSNNSWVFSLTGNEKIELIKSGNDAIFVGKTTEQLNYDFDGGNKIHCPVVSITGFFEENKESRKLLKDKFGQEYDKNIRFNNFSKTTGITGFKNNDDYMSLLLNKKIINFLTEVGLESKTNNEKLRGAFGETFYSNSLLFNLFSKTLGDGIYDTTTVNELLSSVEIVGRTGMKIGKNAVQGNEYNTLLIKGHNKLRVAFYGLANVGEYTFKENEYLSEMKDNAVFNLFHDKYQFEAELVITVINNKFGKKGLFKALNELMKKYDFKKMKDEWTSEISEIKKIEGRFLSEKLKKAIAITALIDLAIDAANF